jgi:hypothetical protein
VGYTHGYWWVAPLGLWRVGVSIHYKEGCSEAQKKSGGLSPSACGVTFMFELGLEVSPYDQLQAPDSVDASGGIDAPKGRIGIATTKGRHGAASNGGPVGH